MNTRRSDPVRLLSAAVALVARDVFLLVRRPSRVAATVLTPALLWAFFAGGFTDAVSSVGEGATEAYTKSLAAGERRVRKKCKSQKSPKN